MDRLSIAFLVFAPATIALVVTLLRRAGAVAYWSSLGAIVLAILLSLQRMHLDSGSLEVTPGSFAIVFLVVPAVAAFSAARLVAPRCGGACVFAVAASAHLLALGAAALSVAAARTFLP